MKRTSFLFLLALAAAASLPVYAANGTYFGTLMTTGIAEAKGLMYGATFIGIAGAVISFVTSRSPGVIASFVGIFCVGIVGANAERLMSTLGITAALAW